MTTMSAVATAPASAGAPTQAELARERDYLLRVARRQLRDGSLAEDVVHDALLSALQARSAFAGRSSLRTWLTSILHHRMADTLRRERRVSGNGDAGAAPALDDDDAALPAAAVDDRDPARRLAAKQALAKLAAELQRLPPLAAQVLLLRRIEGRSNDETAAQLQLDPLRVPAILHRALVRLKRGLDGHGAAAARVD
ncbi:MAG: sigma-70 family RNA polymerase sigma factor [Ideonella sp.]|nr:sigma-70 family RNA polymerase sigma factor [Ideonella sp.]MCC7459645.1 sigma-70 family RNA polymerase sigma factor [Nitrospira sp.]